LRGSWRAGVPRLWQAQHWRIQPKKQERSLGALGSGCRLRPAGQARGVRLLREGRAQRWERVVFEPAQIVA